MSAAVLVSVPAVLVRAAELLDERGWCPEGLDPRGRLDALDAIALASSGEEHRWTALGFAARDAVELSVGGDLISWQAEPGMSWESVAAELRHVAERESEAAVEVAVQAAARLGVAA